MKTSKLIFVLIILGLIFGALIFFVYAKLGTSNPVGTENGLLSKPGPPCQPADIWSVALMQTGANFFSGNIELSKITTGTCSLMGYPEISLKSGDKILAITQENLSQGGAQEITVREFYPAVINLVWSNWCGNVINQPISIVLKFPTGDETLEIPVLTPLKRSLTETPACISSALPSQLAVGKITSRGKTILPQGEGAIVSINDSAKTVVVNKGQKFLIKFGTDYIWRITSSDLNIVAPVNANAALEKDDQGQWQTINPGQAMLYGIGEPVCRSLTPACAAPDLLYSANIYVPGPDVGVSKNWQTYPNQEYGFTLQYPDNFDVKVGVATPSFDWWLYKSVKVAGRKLVKITVPTSFAQFTNFKRAELTVGASGAKEALANCRKLPINPNVFGGAERTVNRLKFFTFYGQNESDPNNVTHSISYRAVYKKQCLAIDLEIFSGNIGIYERNLGIREFEYDEVAAMLDKILQTFSPLKK